MVGFAPGRSRIPDPATGNLTSGDGESWRRRVPAWLFWSRRLYGNGIPYGALTKKARCLSTASFLLIVIRLGFEPKTHSLEGCCSIQLSYRTILKFRHEGCPFAKNGTANIGIFYLMAMFPGESFCKFYMPDTQETETGGVRKMYICLF